MRGRGNCVEVLRAGGGGVRGAGGGGNCVSAGKG